MSAGTSSVDLTLATQSTRDLSGPLQAIPEVRGPDFSRQMDFEDSGCDLCEDMDRQEVTRSSSDLSGTASSLEMNTSSDSHESVSQTNLIVNYFPQELSESVFLDLFQSFGPTRNCKLVKDLGTGK
jgi:RNA recognition motif. (a.k.a. RRM, RBD, or RNP domain)